MTAVSLSPARDGNRVSHGVVFFFFFDIIECVGAALLWRCGCEMCVVRLRPFVAWSGTNRVALYIQPA